MSGLIAAVLTSAPSDPTLFRFAYVPTCCRANAHPLHGAHENTASPANGPLVYDAILFDSSVSTLAPRSNEVNLLNRVHSKLARVLH
jgi:hypothetical protein